MAARTRFNTGAREQPAGCPGDQRQPDSSYSCNQGPKQYKVIARLTHKADGEGLRAKAGPCA